MIRLPCTKCGSFQEKHTRWIKKKDGTSYFFRYRHCKLCQSEIQSVHDAKRYGTQKRKDYLRQQNRKQYWRLKKDSLCMMQD